MRKYTLLLLSFVLLFLYACEKDSLVSEPIESQEKLNDELISEKEIIEAEEKKTAFIKEITGKLASQKMDISLETITHNYGSPKWDSGILTYLNNDKISVAIPTVKEKEKHVSSIIFAYRESLNDEISYKIIELEKIDNLPINGKMEAFDINYKIAVSLFIHTEHIIFGSVHRYLIDRLQNINDPVNNRTKISTRNICTVTLEWIYTWTDWVDPRTGTYMGFTNMDSSVEWADDDCYHDITPGGGGDNSWGNGADNTNPGSDNDNCGEEEKICIGNLFDYPDMKCTFQKLKDKGMFKSLMKEFVGSSRVDIEFNILDKVTINGKEVRAKTYAETGYNSNLYIDISKSVLEEGFMMMALTLLHEGIHAEIKRIQLENVTFPINDISDSNQIWDDYIKYKYTNATNSQHEYMIDKYTSKLGDALYNFAISHFNSEDVGPKKLYKDFAYIGLQNTNTWKNILTDSKKKEIKDGLNKIYFNYNPKNINCQ